MQQNLIATIIIFGSILSFLAENATVQANSNIDTTTTVVDKATDDNANKSVAPLQPQSPLVQSLNQSSNVNSDSQPTSQPHPLAKPTTHQQSNSNTAKIARLKQEIEWLKLQNTVLSLQNLVQTEQHAQELLKLQQDKDKLTLQNELAVETNRHKLAQLQAEKEQLLLENELQSARQTQLLAQLEVTKRQLELENEINAQANQQLLTELTKEKDRLALLNAVQAEKNQQQELQIQLETAQLNLAVAQFEFAKSKSSLNLEELIQKISTREQREIWESQVNNPQEYLLEPFVDGHLIISDRKINLDMVIVSGTAEYVNDKINFYNNKNTEYPIFLIIDRCYGGSVMEGSKILEVMHNSRAPVYVVVKTLAASMAAVLTALAKRSYAYPNAILVHHQMLSFAFGNERQIAEQMAVAQEWTKRIMHPVAQKMGITMAEFTQKMYEQDSSGNWREFADKAMQLKWVDQIVRDIRDASVIRKPDDIIEVTTTEEEPNLRQQTFTEKTDIHGQRYVELPQLIPLDLYYLYNPNNYYR
jgi:ATP-dependent Clp protease protease subunit